jgi:hypothetical protein
VGAGTVTLRVGDRLVGVRVDTAATRRLLDSRFGAWIDRSASMGDGAAVPWAFDLRLESGDPGAADDRERGADPPVGRGPRPVPQLRIGSSLLARSRDPEAVVDALDDVLGGMLARDDETRRWIGMRLFVAGDDAVLVDATPPALTANPHLHRSGVVELTVWTVAVEDRTVLVPPSLTAGEAPWATYRLAGLVAVDRCDHESPDEHEAQHPTTPGSLLARFATRHPSTAWFDEVRELVEGGRIVVVHDRPDAAGAVVGLLAPAVTV